jgi:hypothetical protein
MAIALLMVAGVRSHPLSASAIAQYSKKSDHNTQLPNLLQLRLKSLADKADVTHPVYSLSLTTL